MLNKYYQEELAFLREMGAEFARANPAAAPFLAERGSDPDVERLLEGFAFLTGRLRQKLDDEFPELTQSLMQVLWPHYLRSVPSLSILQFEALPNVVREPQMIGRGAEIASVEVEDTTCRFRTCWEVQLLPLTLQSAGFETPSGSVGALRLVFRRAAGAQTLGFERLRLFLHGEPALTSTLFLYLTRGVERIEITPGGGAPGTGIVLPPDSVRPACYDQELELLPYPPNVFPGYRLLQEYFALPEVLQFLDITGLQALSSLGDQSAFEIWFHLKSPPDSGLAAKADTFRLNCTPVVNLFTCQSDPIAVDHDRVEYLVRAEGMALQHAEVFSVDAATGWVRGTAEQRDLPAFAAFDRGHSQLAEEGLVYHQTRLRESVLGQGVDTRVSFVSETGEDAVPASETVVMELTCTNRGLPAGLRVGDISQPTAESPQFARFRNITPVTPALPPPLGPGLHWKLISNMTLNYLTLASVEALRSLLSVYNFRALYDRQAQREHELHMAALQSVQARPDERFHHGAPIRGTRVEIEMKESNFAGEGEMVMFGTVINEFLANYCTMNSYTRLVVRGAEEGEVYTWNPRIGRQTLI